MKRVWLIFSLVGLLEAGVPVNIPCLTGASERGTTVPPCSGAGGGGNRCRPLGPGRCAVLYDERDCSGWARDVTEGEQTSLRWWDLSVFKYRITSDTPHYEINPLGSQVARLILRVSSEVTPQLLMELVSHNSGQSFLTCEQAELDRVGREYEQCVRQTAHQSRCVSREQEVCQWLEVFLQTCTHHILNRCLTDEATEMLLSVKTRLVMENQLKLKKMCVASQSQVRSPLVLQFHSQEKITSSKWLRLG